MYEPGLESGAALLYAPVRAPARANLAFNPRSGLWQKTEMCADSHICFCLSYSGNRRFIYPVPEAGEDSQALPIDTPQAVAEVCEFYHDASSNIALPMAAVKRSLKQVLDRCSVKIWINRQLRLLPIHAEGSGPQLPETMREYLCAYSANDFDRVASLGGESWEMLCKKHARYLARTNHEPITDGEFMWDGSNIRAFSSGDRCQFENSTPSLTPQFAFRPNRKIMSSLFCSEFFAYTSEGRGALERCFSKWGSFEELRRNLTNAIVEIPRNRRVQIRYAIELRATRYAGETLSLEQLNRSHPFASAIPKSREKLLKLARL